MAPARRPHEGATLIEKHSSRQWQKDKTRQRITEAALEMFREHGFTAVTIEDIAKKAGIGRTTFYLHFQTKVDLANEIGLAMSDRFGANFRALGAVPPESTPKMRAWLRNMVAMEMEHTVSVMVAVQANVADPELAQDFFDVVEEWAYETIAGAGYDPDTAPRAAIEAIRLAIISVDRFVYLRYHQGAVAPRSLDYAMAAMLQESLKAMHAAFAAAKRD